MIQLLLPEEQWNSLRDAVLVGTTERCAVIFAYQASSLNSEMRLLGRETLIPDETDYTRLDASHAELSPAFVLRVSKIAQENAYSVVFVHSHRGKAPPRFSVTDDKGEVRLATFLVRRGGPGPHASLVISPGGARCRVLGSNEFAKVVAVGHERTVLFDPANSGRPVQSIFDRQIRALGRAGQNALARLSVGIVGLGGTGSVVTQQLAHLGVGEFTLIDPDMIEPSNLNRVANACASDISRPKVEIAARYVMAVAPGAHVSAVQGDVIWARCGRALLDSDLVFCCTDSQGSRAVLEQIAYQYLIPMIDMGSVISVLDHRIAQVVGRAQMIAPGLACFTCSGLLDPDQVRRDMLTAFERKSDPYIEGAYEPAPSVMSLNSTVASLSVTMALAVVAGLPVPARHLVYRALASSVRAVATAPREHCVICSADGRLARGDSWPFPGRQD